MQLSALVESFKRQRVLVIGDAMIDLYIDGDTNRFTSEVPRLPIIRSEKLRLVPGGAANTAANVVALGGTCFFAGIVGEHPWLRTSSLLRHLFAQAGIDTTALIEKPLSDKETLHAGDTKRGFGTNIDLEDFHLPFKLRTTVDLSPVGYRIDLERPKTPRAEEYNQMFKAIDRIINDIDVILVSDYEKGLLNPAVFDRLKKYGKPLVGDLKPAHMPFATGFRIIKPNIREFLEMCHKTYHIPKEAPLTESAQQVAQKLNSNFLITLGKDGIMIAPSKGQTQTIPTEGKDVYDVTGAGDTVAAVIALCHAHDLHSAATLGNIAAGIKVGKRGTIPVYADELLKELVRKKN